ncbi:MAG: hypothetical protein QMC65_05250 [Candidatus Poseidoniaceae archaeon]
MGRRYNWFVNKTATIHFARKECKSTEISHNINLELEAQWAEVIGLITIRGAAIYSWF